MSETSEMCDVAINTAVRQWMRESPTITTPMGVIFTSNYARVTLLQARCDELDWRLSYSRDYGTVCEFTATVRPVVVHERARVPVTGQAGTLPMAICMAVAAAIERMTPPKPAEPERELVTLSGPYGCVKYKNIEGDRYAVLLDRCGIDDKDGVRFFDHRHSVHITDPKVLLEIADWLEGAATDLTR